MKKFKRFLVPLLVLVLLVFLAAASYFNQYRGLIFKSQARISDNNGQIKIDFNIIGSDKTNAAKFSQNLGVDQAWMSGLSFKLNQDTDAAISPYLPDKVNLEFFPKEVDFDSSGSSLKGQSSYHYVLEDPSNRLTEATKSGMIHLSDQLQGLYKLLSKVATIDITLSGKNIKGFIKLN